MISNILPAVLESLCLLFAGYARNLGTFNFPKLVEDLHRELEVRLRLSFPNSRLHTGRTLPLARYVRWCGDVLRGPYWSSAL